MTSLASGNLEWLDKNKSRCLVMWRRPEEWGKLIYQWVSYRLYVVVASLGLIKLKDLFTYKRLMFLLSHVLGALLSFHYVMETSDIISVLNQSDLNYIRLIRGCIKI